jgi:hypothetical protein
MSSHHLQVRIVALILVQEIKRLGLRSGAATVPDGRAQRLGGVGARPVREDVLEGLGPLHPIVQALQVPELLQEMQKGRVCVGGILRVHGALVVDEGVGGHEGGDHEGRDAECHSSSV